MILKMYMSTLVLGYFNVWQFFSNVVLPGHCTERNIMSTVFERILPEREAVQDQTVITDWSVISAMAPNKRTISHFHCGPESSGRPRQIDGY